MNCGVLETTARNNAVASAARTAYANPPVGTFPSVANGDTGVDTPEKSVGPIRQSYPFTSHWCPQRSGVSAYSGGVESPSHGFASPIAAMSSGDITLANITYFSPAPSGTNTCSRTMPASGP